MKMLTEQELRDVLEKAYVKGYSEGFEAIKHREVERSVAAMFAAVDEIMEGL